MNISNPSHDPELVPIRRAAELLGVSVDTVRRWEKKGEIESVRSNGGHRLFSVHNLIKYKNNRPLKITEAAVFLQISPSTLRRYEDQGKITPERIDGVRVYREENLKKFKSAQALTPNKPKQKAVSSSNTIDDNAKKPVKPTGVIQSKDPVLVSPKEGVDKYVVRELSELPLLKKQNSVTTGRSFVKRRAVFPALVVTILIMLLFSMYIPIRHGSDYGGNASLLSNALPADSSSYTSGITRLAGLSDTNSPRVLALSTQDLGRFMEINLPALFRDQVSIDGVLSLQNSLDAPGQNINLGSGSITASNLVHSLQGQTGDITLQAGDGITIDGSTIINTSPGVLQEAIKGIKVGNITYVAESSDDLITLQAGENVTLELNTATGILSLASTDTDTTYSAGDDLQLSGTEFSLEDTLDSVTTLNLSGTGKITNLKQVDTTTEDTIEALIFDTDAHTILGAWTVADAVPFSIGTGGLSVTGSTTLNAVAYNWPASIDGDDYVLTAQTDGTLAWQSVGGGGLGSVDSIGDCNGGDCFDGTSDGGSYLKYYGATSGTTTFTVGVDTADSDKFKISTTALGTSDRFVIDADGNVGIGTATPNATLDILGSFSSSTPLIEVGASGGLGISYLLRGFNGSSEKIHIWQNYSGAADTLHITNNWNPAGGKDYSPTGAWDLSMESYNNGPFLIRSWPGGGSAATRFAITQGGLVGIGTTNPTSKLHLIQTTPTTDILTISDSGSGTTTTGVDGLAIDFTAASDAEAGDTNAGLNISATASGDSGDSLYGLNIASAGISAGTLYALNIPGITPGAGTEYALNIGTGWDRGLYVQSPAEFTSSLTVDSTTLVVNASGYEDRVGVGIASPSEKLEIDSGYIQLSNNYGIKGRYLSGTPFDLLKTTSNDVYLNSYGSVYLTSTTGRIVFRSGAIEKARLHSNGNFGIHMTTPSYPLDVSGTINATGDGYFGGNVGIGTADPSYRLHVKGSSTDSTVGMAVTNSSDTALFYVQNNGAVVVGNSAPSLSTPSLSLGGTSGVRKFLIYDPGSATSPTVSGFGQDLTGTYNTDLFYTTDAATPTIGAFRIGTWNGTAYNPQVVVQYDGKVGIGDTSPDQLLEVMSSGAANTQITVSNTNAGDYDPQIGFELADGTNTFTIGIDDSDSDKFKISTTALGTSDFLSIASSGLVQIGSAGSGTLSVPGSGTGSEQFGVSASATGTQSLAVGNSATVNDTYGVAVGYLSIAGQNSVAIGKSSNSDGTAKVAVGAGATASGNYATALGYGTTASGTAAIAIGRDAAAGANQLVIGSSSFSINEIFFGKGVTNATPTAFTINGTGGSGTNIAGAALQLAGGKGTGNAVGGDIIFQTSDAGASGTTLQSLTAKMTIKADGKVGIGTATPQNKLDIEGGAVIGATYSGTSATPTNGMLVEGSVGIGMTSGLTGVKVSVDGGSNTSILSLRNTAAAGYPLTLDSAGARQYSFGGNSSSDYSLGFENAGSGGFNVHVLGSVGIGTATPISSKLHVAGGNMALTNSSADATLYVGENDSLTGGSYGYLYWSRGSDVLALGTNGGGVQLFLNENSNIGIGETSPGSKLSISGNLSIGSSYDTLSAPSNGIIVEGRVGIGDTTPDQLLEVLSSDAANTQLSIGNTNAGDYDPQIGFELADGTNTFTIGVDDSDSDKFKISTTALGTGDYLSIASTGLVQIGSAGSGTLSVPGSGTASEQFGSGAVANSNYSVAIGNTASATGVAATSVGNNATATTNATSLGQAATSAIGGTAIGASATAAGNFGVAVGNLSSAAGIVSTAIGMGASAGHQGAVALGGQSATTATNQLVAGSSDYPINNLFFGKGVTNATPSAFTINGTGGSGTNIAGAALQLAGGKGTGNAVGGDIIFQTSDAGASGSTLQSLTAKMTIKADGKVGIGTSTPNVDLHIGSDDGNLAIGSSAGNSNYAIDVRSSLGTLLSLKSGSTSRFVVSSSGQSDFFLNSGSAEVGKVSISTPTGNPGLMIYTGTTYDQNRFDIANSGTNFYLRYGADAAGLGININSGGNVGIGTASPAAKFHVADGVIQADNGSGIARFQGNDQNDYIDIIGNSPDAMSFVVDGAEWLRSNNFSVSGLSPGISTVATMLKASFGGHLIFDLQNNDATDAVAFRHSATNNGTVDTIGFVYKGDGKVGIGTASPETKLDVAGDAKFNSVTTNDDMSRYLVLGRYSAPFPSSYIAPSANSTGFSFMNAAQDTVLFTILNSGNVGIGTAEPGAKLDIDQTSAARGLEITGANGTATNFVDIRGGTTGTNALVYLHQNVVAGNNGPTLWVRTGGTTNQNPGLFVGGANALTTGPVAQFNKTDSIDSGGSLLATDTVQMRVGGSGTGAGLRIYSRTIANETGPLLALSQGHTSAAQTALQIALGSATAIGLNITAAGSHSGNLIQITSNGGSTGDRFMLTGEGFVGIGDTSPSALLTIGDGDLVTINATGQVDAGTAGDGLVTKVNAGVCDDSVFTTDTNGLLCIDSTNGRIYFRYGDAWHYSDETAGFQIPNLVRNGQNETEGLNPGDYVIGKLDERMSDGALHGVYVSINDLIPDLNSFAETGDQLALLEMRLTAVEERVKTSNDPSGSASGTTSPSKGEENLYFIQDPDSPTNLLFAKDLTLQGLLSVYDDAVFESQLTVKSDVTMYASLVVDSVHIANALNVHGDTNLFGNLTVNKDVYVKGSLSRSNEKAGRAIIKKGAVKVEVKYGEAFASTPIVQLTPRGKVADYSIPAETEDGFEIVLEKPAERDVTFNWLAIMLDDVTESVGDDVVQGEIGEPETPIDSNVTEEQTNNTSVPSPSLSPSPSPSPALSPDPSPVLHPSVSPSPVI